MSADFLSQSLSDRFNHEENGLGIGMFQSKMIVEAWRTNRREQ
jgi:hypothetical protein